MATINLREYYSFYQSDMYIEIPDELAAQLAQWDRDDKAYYRRRRRNKAYYSLDFGDNIEKHVLFVADSPDEYWSSTIKTHTLVKNKDEGCGKKWEANTPRSSNGTRCGCASARACRQPPKS